MKFLYSMEEKGHDIETVSNANSYHSFCDVYLLFHGSRNFFKEFTLFLDFGHGPMVEWI